MRGKILYLDYAASTPLRLRALQVLKTSMKEDFANPASAHQLGRDLQRRIETCREKFLEFLGAREGGQLIFTGSATEANNTVIRGIGLRAGDPVIFSFADHPSITVPMEILEKRGIQVMGLPLQKDGTTDKPGLLELLDKAVRLVILTHVNNQSGTITDIGRLSGEIKAISPYTHIHVDAAQGFGKILFSLKEGYIDSLCISAHKIGGPKGIAGLYLRNGVQLSPLLYGGGQEKGLRSSTQAAPLIFSFYEAAVEAMNSLEFSLDHVTAMNQLARESLKERVNMVRFPFVKNSSPYILTFILPGIPSDIILRHLEQQGIMISSRAACSSRIKGTDPVFTALHLPKDEHKFVLRVSFSHVTTGVDVLRFCDTLASICDDLKMFTK
ncbi:MAG: aminotransferase class V-fold PLP-dependent enzyme [Candidatus Aminicenantes bacterium]|jgi:cysteine desulfurase